MLHHTLGCYVRTLSERLRFRVLSELAEWDAITCVQQCFYWAVRWLTDGDLGLHGRRFKSYAAEVPRLIGCTVDIRGPPERKENAVDQDRNQTNCYRCQ